MPANSVEGEIKTFLDKLDIPHHPLAIKIGKGELSEKQVKGWAKQWYHGFLKDADRWIAQAFVNCPVPAMRRSIIENAAEEAWGYQSKTKGHPELFVDFLGGLGISQDELDNEPVTPEAHASLLQFWQIRSVPWFQFGPLFLTSESEVPRAYVPIMQGLEQHYGVPKDRLLFFKIHAAEVDEAHTATNLKVIREYVQSDRDREECLGILKTTATLISELMGVYRKY